MATTLTRNLKLKVNSNLTAEAKYNLERIDLLGSTFLVDSTDTLRIRSQTDILIEPESADVGGSGNGGSISLGSAGQNVDLISLNTDVLNVASPLGSLDQSVGGTRYLRVKYKSDQVGLVDTAADRTLSVSLSGSDRQLNLGGDYTSTGGDLTFTLQADSSLILPVTGTLSTLAGNETLTNKVIDADSNSITSIRNSSIHPAAAIAYSKLDLTGGITNTDISSSATIAYSKLNLSNSIVDTDIATGAAISRQKLSNEHPNWVLINDASGRMLEEPHLAKVRGGAGQDQTNVTYPTTGVLVTRDAIETLTNKSMDGAQNTFSNIPFSALNLIGQITNNSIAPSAGIVYSKLDLAGSLLDSDISPLASISRAKIATGSPAVVIVNDGSGALSEVTQLAIGMGGTGASSAGDAINNLLPDQTGQGGKVLSTDGDNPQWITVSGTGTVTSVALSAPSVFVVSGSPVTTTGTLTLALNTQTANTVWAGPGTGSPATPTFRSLVAADLPPLTTSMVTEGSNLYYTDERVDDRVAALVQAGTNITVTYNDVANTLTIATPLTQYDNEMAQDAVGTILADSSTIDFTYNDSAPSITAAVLPGGVDHDQLLNFVANEHVDHSSVTIGTSNTSGLSGGGDITASRNLSIAPANASAVTVTSSDIVLIGDASNSNALARTTVGDIIALVAGTYAATWSTGDGVTKVITHNLGTLDVIVQIYEIDTGETILVDSVTRTSINSITCVSSVAPTGSGFRVLVKN